MDTRYHRESLTRKLNNLQHDLRSKERELELVPPGQMVTPRGRMVNQVKNQIQSLKLSIRNVQKEINLLNRMDKTPNGNLGQK